ncbi:MAG: hypothetical protein ACUVWV_13560 [Thermodesulfobacteriota bacterium]
MVKKFEGLIVRALNPMGVNQKELSRLVEMIKNFLGISKSYPRSSKYHPAQIFFTGWWRVMSFFLF